MVFFWEAGQMSGNGVGEVGWSCLRLHRNPHILCSFPAPNLYFNRCCEPAGRR